MASNQNSPLNAAIAVMNDAYTRLEAAVAETAATKAQSAAEREAVQLEITTSWQSHSAGLENQVGELQSENEYLKAENARVTNQLAALQQDYLELQNLTGSAINRLDGAVEQLDLMLKTA